MTKRRRSRYKRGYPVAILIGLSRHRARIWRIYSEVIKPYETVELTKVRTSLAENELYNFHEKIVDVLRPLIKKDIRSIIIASPRKTDYVDDFLEHIQKHHAWLTRERSSNALVFGTVKGPAGTEQEVRELVLTEEFHKTVEKTTAEEGENIIEALEERLIKVDQGEVVLYSLKAIEQLTYGRWPDEERKPEYVMLTNRFLNQHKQKGRVYRLLQILRNKNVKTKIVDAETAAGERINQFGGLICFTKVENQE
jgi:stalled ribosome rescue protein Dom34